MPHTHKKTTTKNPTTTKPSWENTEDISMRICNHGNRNGEEGIIPTITTQENSTGLGNGAQ